MATDRAFRRAIEKGDVEDCKRLVEEEGANVTEKDEFGRSTLMIACACDHLDIVEFLVSKGANVNDTDNDGRSCLMRVCFFSQINIIEFLLYKGAYIHEINEKGDTCLYYARNHSILYRLYKWPTTMAILVLQELALIYIIDSESVIDLHQYLEGLKT